MKRTTRNLARAGLCAAAILGLTRPAMAQQSPRVPPLAAFFQPASATPTTPDEEGFIRRWLLLEPIAKPNPTNTVFTGNYVRAALNPGTFPGRFGTVPRDGQTVEAGGTLRWHALESKLWDVKLFNFAQSLGKPKYGVVFWAVTVIDSPREMRNVRMAVGSNSASIWWLNGAETATLFDDRRMVMDDVLSDRVTLKKGRNVIYGAVINGPGLSDFCLRFLDERGQPIRDLAIDVK
ncbi:acetylxylan esterase [Sphingomonas suaedae]|uniref:Acetylxylan esterase n=1 Tax=Sphingomonas suaedae TaxID=2599297 RepID=A0A518RAX0_9SPHN|nr:acetylxylan esterase [Sphingomonas suaedae]QDX24612.1 acetylxylan esterase [Sphingomonas suaedae]